MKKLTQLDAWLAPGEPLRTWLDPVFRVATSLIFIIGGLGHFAAHDHMLERMQESPWRNALGRIGDPSWLLWLSGIVFVIFGVTLALGFLTRISALLILITLVPVTIAVHVAPGHMGPFLKNIAIMGSLLYFFANGRGALRLIVEIHSWLESKGNFNGEPKAFQALAGPDPLTSSIGWPLQLLGSAERSRSTWSRRLFGLILTRRTNGSF